LDHARRPRCNLERRFAEEVELEVRMAAVGRVIDDLGAGPAGYPTFVCFQARRARARTRAAPLLP